MVEVLSPMEPAMTSHAKSSWRERRAPETLARDGQGSPEAKSQFGAELTFGSVEATLSFVAGPEERRTGGRDRGKSVGARSVYGEASS